jgi:hypothetical protein
MYRSSMKRALILFLILHTATLGLSQAVGAGPIGTKTLLELEERSVRLGRLQAFVAREDVRTMLTDLGVSPESAQSRIASLTNEELRMLEQRIDSLPAGGDGVFVLVGVVFVVLLVLELVGVTNIFTKL